MLDLASTFVEVANEDLLNIIFDFIRTSLLVLLTSDPFHILCSVISILFLAEIKPQGNITNK
jgi:hypothetical protein